MTRKHALLVLFSFCFLFFVGAAIVTAADDMELPPPPDADSDFSAPPPPDMGDGDMPPAPEMAGEDMPPPPEEASGDELPPPAEEAEAEEVPPAPDEEMASEELAPPPGDDGETPAAEKTTMSYKVKRGDSLWKISGKSSVYGDSFKWPLIYKANKATIEDPDLIYPKQKLSIKKDYPESVVEDAVEKAKETPPYEPHTSPRKKLPIKY